METVDKVVQNLKKAADVAQKETSRLTELAKLKYKLMREKSKLDDQFDELGRACYRQHQEGGVTDNEIAEIIARIEVSKAEIEHLKIKIRIAKENGKTSGEKETAEAPDSDEKAESE